MLKKRMITAIILVPLVIWGVFYLSPLWFGWISAFVFLLAGWEWGIMCGLQKLWHRVLYIVSMLVAFLILGGFSELYLLILGLITWIILPCFLIRTELFGHFWEKHKQFRLLLGIWLLSLAWLAINFIMWETPGSLLLLTLFLWVWGADTGAYFIGRRFGRHKLAPNISPGKTWEGVLGGLFITFIIALTFGLLLFYSPKYYLGLLLLSVVVGVVSVLGDLVESMIKRQSDVKDSGSLLPGHGGFLDRLDSLLSAAPVFAVGTVLLEYLK